MLRHLSNIIGYKLKLLNSLHYCNVQTISSTYIVLTFISCRAFGDRQSLLYSVTHLCISHKLPFR